MKKLTLFALAFALLTSCSSNDDEGNKDVQEIWLNSFSPSI